ncbi:hypothetical protein DL89DRAFT_135399 [Linderina pennispora]|uniref:Uncharacterized protein n=1 Tax=Linderina pennispora TaxID=61395 RepID=A0A1Y1WB91_9FUNG|nr:uncharacterized protein DL89DRAFT_135399 [Linderina pennispora]ORX70516.1 hypothetical protein DL89DRAFT_135399 [Linderina pennispora]
MACAAGRARRTEALPNSPWNCDDSGTSVTRIRRRDSADVPDSSDARDDARPRTTSSALSTDRPLSADRRRSWPSRPGACSRVMAAVSWSRCSFRSPYGVRPASPDACDTMLCWSASRRLTCRRSTMPASAASSSASPDTGASSACGTPADERESCRSSCCAAARVAGPPPRPSRLYVSSNACRRTAMRSLPPGTPFSSSSRCSCRWCCSESHVVFGDAVDVDWIDARAEMLSPVGGYRNVLRGVAMALSDAVSCVSPCLLMLCVYAASVLCMLVPPLIVLTGGADYVWVSTEVAMVLVGNCRARNRKYGCTPCSGFFRSCYLLLFWGGV